MAKRRSIYVDGFVHVNPIPAACRLGALLISGGIHGRDPATGKTANTIEDQCAIMFQHVRAILQRAGGTTDNIVKMTFWMNNRDQRNVLNTYWLAMFPDERARPARHTIKGDLEGGMLVQCDFVALLDDEPSSSDQVE